MLRMTMLRKQRGWSGLRTAQEARLAPGDLSRAERKTLVLYPVQLRRLAKALEWPEAQADALMEEVSADAQAQVAAI